MSTENGNGAPPYSDSGLETSKAEERYLAFVEKLGDDVEGSSSLLEKTTITIAAGALGISIAFARDIVGDGVRHLSTVLVFAWIMFAISIAFMVMVLYLNVITRERLVEWLVKHGFTEDWERDYYKKWAKTREIRSLILFRWGAVGALLIGLVLLITFGANNF